MQLRRSLNRLAALAIVSLAPVLAPAHAAPLPPATIVGQDLFAGGTSVTAAFLFADAGDDSDLDVSVNFGPASFLFSNSNSVTNNQSAIGSQQTFATFVGAPLVFTLSDLSVPNVWSTGAGSTNVAYLASSSIAVVETALGINLSAAGEAALTALGAVGPVIVVAFEDRLLANSDRDYNDLVFAFAPVFARQVPEPGSLVLLAAGLLGLGMSRRRRLH